LLALPASSEFPLTELNGLIKNFDGKLQDKCLNETLFDTLRNARKTLEELQKDYNWRTPRSALSNLTQMEFLQGRAMDKMANYCRIFNPKESAQSGRKLRAKITRNDG